MERRRSRRHYGPPASGDLYETRNAGVSWSRINYQFDPALLVNDIPDPQQSKFYVATEIGVFER